MTAQVIELASDAAVDRAWDDYCQLIREMWADDSLRTNLAHNQQIVRAWNRWRDLFNMREGR